MRFQFSFGNKSFEAIVIAWLIARSVVSLV